MRGHFQSVTKMVVTTFDLPYIAENPMLRTNLTALCVVELELCPIEVLHCKDKDFRPFCSCDLDLDPMTFIYELDPYLVKMYRRTKNELSMSGLSKVIALQTDRQTDRHTPPKLYTMPLHWCQ